MGTPFFSKLMHSIFSLIIWILEVENNHVSILHFLEVLVGAKIFEVIPYVDLLSPCIVIFPSEAFFGTLFVWVISFSINFWKDRLFEDFPIPFKLHSFVSWDIYVAISIIIPFFNVRILLPTCWISKLVGSLLVLKLISCSFYMSYKGATYSSSLFLLTIQRFLHFST